MSSQGAISSLVYSSGAVVTAASMGYVFGRPTKKKKNNKITQLSNISMDFISNNNNNDMSISPSSTTSTLSSTVTSSSPKSPLKRFKLFRSKSKRSKISSSRYVHPTTTVVHPHMVHPDQLVDDDTSSICSDMTSVYIVNDRDRRTMSVPNLPVTLQQSQSWDNSPSMSITSGTGPYIHHSINETLHEEDEEDFENWDVDSGFNEPLSKIAGTSSPSLPLSAPPPPIKRHSRCKSLPPINVQEFSPSLFRRQPTPSEIWDDDFELDDNNELNVPSLVEETQFSLRMDISNIRDFVSQIEELKSLVEEKEKLSAAIQSKVTTRKWTNGFLRRTASKKAKQLENVFKKDWEEAAVIIDIADFAENNENNEETVEGDRRVEVGIEHIPSERHMEVLKKIVVEGLGEDAKELMLFDDDDKENQCDNNNNDNNSNPHPSKKQKLIPFFSRNDHSDDNESENDKKRRRRKNFRVSVEVMPSLVDHLKKLRVRLDYHVKELGKLACGTI